MKKLILIIAILLSSCLPVKPDSEYQIRLEDARDDRAGGRYKEYIYHTTRKR